MFFFSFLWLLQVMTLLQQGNRNRTTEPTRVNETSSRSHAILQVNHLGFEGKRDTFNVVIVSCYRLLLTNQMHIVLLHLGCG